jgi:hypothetical protein
MVVKEEERDINVLILVLTIMIQQISQDLLHLHWQRRVQRTEDSKLVHIP